MIRLERTSVMNFENALRGMRNPMNSWDKSDSVFTPCPDCGGKNCCILESCPHGAVRTAEGCMKIGANDLDLAQRLVGAGSDDRKFLRQIFVSVDVTAPLYWWKEYDTYKVGTVANSTSTMHTIHKKEFTLDDFSHEHLTVKAENCLLATIDVLNEYRESFLGCTVSKFADSAECAETKKLLWWQMIQLLPSSYNQMRTCTLNYENLINIYYARKNHKLDEWHVFCDWIAELPYFKEMCIKPMEAKK